MALTVRDKKNIFFIALLFFSEGSDGRNLRMSFISFSVTTIVKICSVQSTSSVVGLHEKISPLNS